MKIKSITQFVNEMAMPLSKLSAYDEVEPFDANHIKVMRNGKYNLVDKNGELISDKWFDSVEQNSEGGFDVTYMDEETNRNVSGSYLGSDSRKALELLGGLSIAGSISIENIIMVEPYTISIPTRGKTPKRVRIIANVIYNGETLLLSDDGTLYNQDHSVFVEKYDAIGRMIEHFGLKYNPSTGCYDCDGNVDLYEYRDGLDGTEQRRFDKAFVKNGKMTIKFGEVKGNFLLPGDYEHRYVLTSLEGCPKSVGGDFRCSNNKLTSLEGCPESVGGDFYCYRNQLTSLEGCSESVGGNFSCRGNDLTSLKGCPKSVGGDFGCDDNDLTSLEGCPKSVGGDFGCSRNRLTSLEDCPENVVGDFDCEYNQLTTLEGCPKNVGGYFYCNDNQLTSLKGCPQTVDGDFWCKNNRLTSLKGCPKTVGGSFYCYDNKVQFTVDDVEAVCDVNRYIYV